MKASIVLLTALLLCAAAAQAEKPADAGNGGGNANASDHGDAGGNSGGNGNAGGNGQSSTEGKGDHGNGQGPAGTGQADGDAADGPGASDGANGPPAHAAQPGQSTGATDAPGSPDATPSSSQAGAQGSGAADIAGDAPGQSQRADVAANAGQGADEGAGNDGPQGGASSDAPGETLILPTSAGPAATEATEALQVQRGPSGNQLAWDLPASAAQVQVWRLDPQGWVPIAVTSNAGQVVDSAGQATSEYRLTWSDQPLAGSALASVASSLSLAPAAKDTGSGIGAWLLALMWAGAAAFGTVRANPGPRRVLETRIADDHQLLPILAGLPGIDMVALDRVVNLGLRTVGQLRGLDAHALAFWTGLPSATVRGWQETVELLQWGALPPGAAQRLALAGHATLAHVASARPAELMATLHGDTANVTGPGLPADEQEVTNWVVEARQAIGVPSVSRAASPGTATVTSPAAPTPAV